nr:translationally-controlled tumor protein homolog [Salvelinus alpinus]
MAGAPAAVKMILGNLDKYQFFTGESMNCDGAIGLLDYREDGVTPFFVFFKDGIEIEKYKPSGTVNRKCLDRRSVSACLP